MPRPLPRPRPEPLDPPMVPYAVGGLVAWAVAGLILLLFQGWLTEHGHTDWLWVCLAGFLIGLPGLAVMIRHDARRHAASTTPMGTTPSRGRTAPPAPSPPPSPPPG